MSLIYNGTTIKKLIYNGTEMKKLIYGTTEVYSSIDPTKSSFTEEEFIAVVNATLQAKMTIGASVTLTNTYSSVYGSTNHVYNVIGVNHQDIPDDTSSIATDSVDLYCSKSVKVLSNQGNWGSTGTQYSVYQQSPNRTWLNDTYYNAFTNVKSLIRTMNKINKNPWNTVYELKDKVTEISAEEFGASLSWFAKNEGVRYEAFPYIGNATSGYSTVYRYSSSKYNGTRTATSNGQYVWVYIDSQGNIGNGGYISGGVAPVIRF